MRNGLGVAAAIAAMLLGVSPASAHDLRCEKTVNGESVVVIDSYPAELNYEISVRNANPVEPSTATAVFDSLLDLLGFEFEPAPPFTLDVDEYVTNDYQLDIESYEDCVELANAEPMSVVYLDNVFTVEFNEGSAQCMARVVCRPEEEEEGGATRTMGFYKTHREALEQCLALGPIDLGWITVSTIEAALGLLWGSPNWFDDHTRRNELEKARFLLGRQTLVGICNLRLFHTDTDPPILLTNAVYALWHTDCTMIQALIAHVDAYNNSGDDVPFPEGFDPGAATPQDNRDLADDPTVPEGEVCD